MRVPGQGSVLVSVKQVHGTDVLVLDRPVREGEPFDGSWDALVTDQLRVTVAVRTADCVPVLLHDPKHKVVAAVHAGWRGAVAGILPKTIDVMKRRFGTEPVQVRVGIGPSAGPCCYEVDEPVLERLRESCGDWRLVTAAQSRNRALLDLRRLVRWQAESIGVVAENIVTANACTICHSDLFFSYRRDGVVNDSMMSGIGLVGR
jgi:YfiH family protein